jgi:hypothetical protein
VFRIDRLQLHPDLERVVLGWEGALEQLRRSSLRVAELQVGVPTEESLLLPGFDVMKLFSLRYSQSGKQARVFVRLLRPSLMLCG